MTQLVARDPAADWYADVPRSIARHAFLGLALMALAFGGFALWAFTAPLAAAVIAPGSFVATGRSKIVRHAEPFSRPDPDASETAPAMPPSESLRG